SGTSNEYGQLGDGTTTGRNLPLDISGLANAISVSAGYRTPVPFLVTASPAAGDATIKAILVTARQSTASPPSSYSRNPHSCPSPDCKIIPCLTSVPTAGIVSARGSSVRESSCPRWCGDCIVPRWTA
ncbi:hypothetical protein KJ612_16395, partial [Myxococcota bacterium]|nr:hypothetical protein [Myxococcota bacterium]